MSDGSLLKKLDMVTGKKFTKQVKGKKDLQSFCLHCKQIQ